MPPNFRCEAGEEPTGQREEEGEPTWEGTEGDALGGDPAKTMEVAGDSLEDLSTRDRQSP